jgi:4-amino-4-deoxy-L-arabinose transferase-like glycosyltransferase
MPLPLRRPLLTALVALLLAAYAWTGWTASLVKGPAFDESAHLVAGYAYWKFNDYRLQPENGNLPQRWAGLALLPLAPRLDPADAPEEWATSDVWRVGQRVLYESGNTPEAMLAAARGAMILWGVAAGLLVFFWSRRLWGDAGGLLSLALCAGSTTMLAHGPLVTSDMAAAFCLLAASGAFWRQLREPSSGRLALSLALTGLTAIAKFSVLLLPGVYALLLVAHWLLPREAAKRSARREAARAALLVAAHGALACLVVWAAFGFRYQAGASGLPAPHQFYVPWDELLPENGPRRAVLTLLKEYRVLPEAYTHGLAYVLQASEARGAFAAGLSSSTGWWWFFPYAFLIKSSFAELAAVAGLSGIIVWAVLAARKRLGSGDTRAVTTRLADLAAPLLALVFVYGAASLASNLNIGHRHILPLYPPLFILAGAFARRSAGRWSAAFAALLVAGQIAAAARAYPSYLASFNPLAGPPENRWRHLVDSSLDWGQDLPALSKWVAANRRPDERVYLGYFGVGDPLYEGMDAKPFAVFSAFWRQPELARLEPGLYCFGATVLQDVYSPVNGPWTQDKENAFRHQASRYRDHPELWNGALAHKGAPAEHDRWVYERLRFARLAQYLRLRRPDAVIDSSMLVYRLDAEEVAIAIDLPTADMVTLLERAAGEPARSAIKARP